MTFSFRPRRSSRLPLTLASVSTRVVSWNDAAEINDSVDSDALVMPSSTGSHCASSLSFSRNSSFSIRTLAFSVCSPLRKTESPGSETSTLRNICRTMISICLSFIFTPCRR